MPPTQHLPLDMLATAVVFVDGELRIRYANAAAENLLRTSAKTLHGQPLPKLFLDCGRVRQVAERALAEVCPHTEHELMLARNDSDAAVSLTISPMQSVLGRFAVELRPQDQHLRVEREARQHSQQEANRVLLRNLAHEIKNPLGGIRGAAQLLQRELNDPDQREYTQVIIAEADRLQSLMDRMLTPHRLPKIESISIHEVLERVRALLIADSGALPPADAVTVERDYDVSLPPLLADREQLIQVFLNIGRNALQALASHGGGSITLRTRAARQVTLARQRHRVALKVQVIDNGPGIPSALRDRIFFPLVSGREDGSGLGLSIAQTYVHQHHGLIDCDSAPGHTSFTVLLPFAHPPARPQS
ncbi:MAG: nitrogen regulation protein NR(II) [Betaproteobacteria bacterium]|nr:nitrogen regulation protein NR(II) [Betaproteobacteria bacterium]